MTMPHQGRRPAERDSPGAAGSRPASPHEAPPPGELSLDDLGLGDLGRLAGVIEDRYHRHPEPPPVSAVTAPFHAVAPPRPAAAGAGALWTRAHSAAHGAPRAAAGAPNAGVEQVPAAAPAGSPVSSRSPAEAAQVMAEALAAARQAASEGEIARGAGEPHHVVHGASHAARGSAPTGASLQPAGEADFLVPPPPQLRKPTPVPAFAAGFLLSLAVGAALYLAI